MQLEIDARRRIVPQSLVLQNPTDRSPLVPVSSAVAVRYTPYALGIVFGLLALRGLPSATPIFSDASRHAMNGVLIHDWLLTGDLTNPVDYGRHFYSRLPAVSLPYHPPLFPAVESLFYLVFGVNLFAARLAVAVMTSVAIIFLFRLILHTHKSYALALTTTLTFGSMEMARVLSGDVMLEFPAMAFLLAALYCLRDLDKEYTLRRGLAFGVLGGAAVWTKQHAAFVGLVPFFFVLFSGRWRILGGWTIWIASGVFGGIVLLLRELMHVVPPNAAGAPVYVTETSLFPIFVQKLPFYLEGYRHNFTDLFGLGIALFVLALLVVKFIRWQRSSPSDLYLAWTLALLLFVLLVGYCDHRYLFFAYPALLTIGYHGLLRLSERMMPFLKPSVIPVGVAAVCFYSCLRTPEYCLHGPAEAARQVVGENDTRILYCGRSEGAFVFAVRTLDAHEKTIVIRGDKFKPEQFRPEAFEEFAQRFGIDYVLLERNSEKYPWDQLRDAPSPSMVLEREIPVVARPYWVLNGNLRIFRFTNPSPTPESPLRMATMGLAREGQEP